MHMISIDMRNKKQEVEGEREKRRTREKTILSSWLLPGLHCLDDNTNKQELFPMKTMSAAEEIHFQLIFPLGPYVPEWQF